MKSATKFLMVILALTALSAPAFAEQTDSKDCASASTAQSKNSAQTVQAPAPTTTSGASSTGN